MQLQFMWRAKELGEEVQHSMTNGANGDKHEPIPCVALLIPEKAVFLPNLLTDTRRHDNLNIGRGYRPFFE